ncbi:hypothetical protein K488DRAFT_80141 [Vararia minispora EC-137]|uniref:Uncharacterized protein n=1 Tax=Vararia minispora EC-137 TaxID=1314806 RepID=A0ACB8QCY6_9AGAM|nr:hypothetical protein K488DRAFT_80141 [Vararia minispora EC-137]
MSEEEEDNQRPAWQTFELDQEWPDDEEEEQAEDGMDHTCSVTDGSSSLSFTGPVGSFQLRGSLQVSRSRSQSPPSPGSPHRIGTVLVREDAPGPDLSRTPAAAKKGAMKNFFSPLALERMFEPPSPPKPTTSSHSQNPAAPSVPSRLSQVHGAESFSGLRPSMDCQFTFAVPHLTPNGAITPPGYPQAESTPVAAHAIPPTTPATDPRLRLFQFQYDTFTRDHLSAMVDSIAVNSPSLSNTGNLTNRHSSPFGLSRVTESTATSSSDVRSAKRVKLSPMSDFTGEGEGARAIVKRDTLRKDYVGESKSLMAQIRQARDFSTISTVASRSGASRETQPPTAVRPSLLDVPRASGTNSAPGSVGSSKGSTYSSLGFRAKGAELMAQIKQDFKGSKRLFSADTTDISQASHADQKSEASFRQSVSGSSRAPHQRRSTPDGRFITPTSPEGLGLSAQADHTNTSMDTARLYAQFPAPPILVAPALSPLRASTASLTAPPSGNVAANPNPTASTLRAVAPGQLAYPSMSLRARTQEDLNRLVSGSTASGTTVTVGSSESFVKHPGPAHIMRIAPEDVPSLPERVGAMVFDRERMRWVKTAALHARQGSVSEGGYAASVEDGESEDPFRDIESLREDDSDRIGGPSVAVDEEQTDTYAVGGHTYPPMAGAIVEAEDEEEAELTSFSFDGPPAQNLHLETGGPFIDEDTDTEDEDVHQLVDGMHSGLVIADHVNFGVEIDDSFDDDVPEGPGLAASPHSPHPQPPITSPPQLLSTPLPPSRNASAAPTPIRSALKNANTAAIPLSGLRDPSSGGSRTPANKGRHRRSVSFSDGKRDGPIRGLSRDKSHDDESAAGYGFVPSARSKRIAELMKNLEGSSDDNDSPTRTTSSGRPPAEELERMANWRPQGGVLTPAGGAGGRTHAFSPARASGVGNATFLTEASFGVAHDKLVQVITDVQPFEPYWEDLSNIDLSRKHLESVARLKEFLPRLRNLILNHNQLGWLSGVPASVRTLSIAHNVLTRMTSFNHLLSLESLDVSNNEIDSLTQLECLRHLRELRADGNRIASLDGILGMDGLTKLSLQGNRVVTADFAACVWSKLEMLNLSHNRVERVKGLASLSNLVVLNLDHNALSELVARAPMPRLRVLRASSNRLTKLDTACFPHLRTLYADNNSLVGLVDARRLARLENLSLRNQGGRASIKRVVTDACTGNPLPDSFFIEPCYNLIYLELAACRLTHLPPGLPALAPNLRALNLNYNFIEDVRPLEGLGRLSKLTVIGSRLKGTKAIVRVLRSCPDAEIIDFRMNPCTLGWYLPLLVHDVPGALQPSDDGGGGDARGEDGGAGPTRWQELDAKFRRDLPDGTYAARLAYRGLIMRACPRVRVLDGVPVSAKERDKAERLLASVLAVAG